MHWQEKRGENQGPRRGDLYFLRHPNKPEIFSGYGLVAAEGRSDHLVGLLMVDRPRRADPAWLDQLEGAYGSYQLIAMTETGERGLLCQMRVERDSRRYLDSSTDTKAVLIRESLIPALAALPNPILKVRWNGASSAWQSQFWIGLPQDMQAVFDEQGYGSFPAERNNAVGFITYAPDLDIANFRGAGVSYEWQLVEMPQAPLVRLQAAILDRPASPYLVESFLNVGDPEQARILGRLVVQDVLTFDFFGSDYEYRYSKEVSHPPNIREELYLVTARAIDYWNRLPAGRRNFDQAKAEYQRRFPL